MGKQNVTFKKVLYVLKLTERLVLTEKEMDKEVASSMKSSNFPFFYIIN